MQGTVLYYLSIEPDMHMAKNWKALCLMLYFPYSTGSNDLAITYIYIQHQELPDYAHFILSASCCNIHPLPCISINPEWHDFLGWLLYVDLLQLNGFKKSTL